MSGSCLRQHALGLPKIQNAGRKIVGCGSQEWFSLDGDIAFSQSLFKCETHQCDSGGQQQVSTIVDAEKLFYSRKRGEVIQLPPKEVDTELLQDAARK